MGGYWPILNAALIKQEVSIPLTGILLPAASQFSPSLILDPKTHFPLPPPLKQNTLVNMEQKAETEGRKQKHTELDHDRRKDKKSLAQGYQLPRNYNLTVLWKKWVLWRVGLITLHTAEAPFLPKLHPSQDVLSYSRNLLA